MRTIGVAAAAATLCFASCAFGQNPTQNDALAGLSPQQALSRAFGYLGTETYAVDVSQALDYDMSAVNPQLQQRLPPQATASRSSKAKEQVAAPQRLKATLTSASLTRPAYFVDYDGDLYLSRDGTTWKHASALGEVINSLHTLDSYTIADDLDGIRDVGKSTQYGGSTEHYTASISQAYLQRSVQRLLGGEPQSSTLTAIENAITFGPSTVDAYVDHSSGKLVHERARVQLLLDFGKLLANAGQAFPGNAGVAKINGDSTFDFHAYGSKVSISKPNASGDATAADLSS